MRPGSSLIASAGGTLTSKDKVEMKKPARLDALTGLRCFAAINIVLFHFSNPKWFGPLAPVVNAGYASVSFFILLSGFVLGYNYNAKARAGELSNVRFYEARFTRLYPIYLLSLIMAFKMIPLEWGYHTHGMFWTGMVLSPLLLQGWIPEIATFLNTPAWTMSAESFYYVLFPWMAKWKTPTSVERHLAKMGLVWILGMIPGTLYVIYNPDGLPHVDRFSYGKWLQALKYTPIPHLASFVFGVMLSNLDEVGAAHGQSAAGAGALWICGDVSGSHPGISAALCTVARRIVYATVWLHYSGTGRRESLVEAAGTCGRWCLWAKRATAFTCCTSILWNMIHDSHVLNRLGLARFDPWISYVLLIALALVALHFVEKPAQRVLRGWMHVWR